MGGIGEWGIDGGGLGLGVMTLASGVGSMPGTDIRETIRVVWGELPDLPFLPELPARGMSASMIGRTAAVITDLGFDLQPAGWRLTDAPGLDHRRAISLLAQDLDALEELTQGYAGPLKLQLAGPWTMAAMVEKPRGDKVLADSGARRDLAQALSEGVRRHLADVQRRVPGASVQLQLDEPALPAILVGRIPTASGLHRHRSVDPPRAAELLEQVIPEGAIVHCCADEVPIGLLRGTGVGGVSLDADRLSPAAYEEIGALLDNRDRLFLGVVATDKEVPSPRALTDRVLRLLDMLGFDPQEVSDLLVLTPGCGLAGSGEDHSRAVLAALREAAATLTEG